MAGDDADLRRGVRAAPFAAFTSLAQPDGREAPRRRAAEESQQTPIAVCGVLGPEGDGYHLAHVLGAGEAESHHAPQIEVLRRRASRSRSRSRSRPDVRLPSEESLGQAIERVDAETAGAAAYFMVNCAHPTHFVGELPGLESGDPAERALKYRCLGPGSRPYA